MLLAFDIGNTNIVVGAFDGERLVGELRLKTDLGRTVDEYASLLFPSFERKLGKSAQFDLCIVSSVVPPLTSRLVSLVEEYLSLPALVVGPGIKTGIAIKLADPTSVGADRVVNSVAARELYGAPALVIDFGTATSFDYVGKEGNFEGGIIAPGVDVALESLVRNTAKLPKIELSWPKHVIGKSTVAAMQSGSVMGYSFLIDGLIEQIIKEEGPIEHIIATGGLGRLFADHSKRIKTYEPHLTLKGLRIIAELNRQPKHGT